MSSENLLLRAPNNLQVDGGMGKTPWPKVRRGPVMPSQLTSKNWLLGAYHDTTRVQSIHMPETLGGANSTISELVVAVSNPAAALRFGPLLRRPGLAAQIERAIDQTDMTVGLRKIAQHAAGQRVELLG